MTYARVSSLSALPISAAVTFGLFLIMTLLVAGDGLVNIDEENSVRFIDVVQDIEDQPPKRIERTVEKPPTVETPPELDVPEVALGGPDKLNINIGRANAGNSVDVGTIDLGPSSDGEYLPLVRVQPVYPRRAQERGIEGYAIVELTVGADGSVPPESIRVVEAEPKGYFERAAINAAKKFKYKPKIVNGTGQAVTGVTYRFSFQLGD
ncbi:MAG: energy transducer TonB [Kordiimonas sp.]